MQVFDAAAPHLEVQVRAAAAAGVAAVGHQLPFLHRQFVGGEEFADAVAALRILFFKHRFADGADIVVEVHIDRGVAVGVLDIEYLAAAPGRDAHLGHIAVGCCIDGFPCLAAGAHVEAGVEVAGTELAEGGRKTYVVVHRIAEVALGKRLRQ